MIFPPRPWRALLALVCLTGAQFFSVPAFASGGDEFSESHFAPEYHVPNAELRNFASGKIGIVPGSYWRIYQLMAYRVLNGQALSSAEQDGFGIAGWGVVSSSLAAPSRSSAPSVANNVINEEGDSLKKWLQARTDSGTLTANAAPLKLEVMADSGEFSSFLNCHDDAFERATQTLKERLKTGGKQWATVWRSNQDQVFANCDSAFDKQKKKRPYLALSPLPANAPTWLKLDYEYQTAAALFYAEQFDAARTKFLQIGKNTESPWRQLAQFLAARCLIRDATLHYPPAEGGKSDPKRMQLLEQARTELLAQSKSFVPAQQLIGWVDARVRPQARLVELAQTLSGKWQGDFILSLSDYLFISDTVARKDLLNSTDPMTAWIAAMQANDSQSSYDQEDKTSLRLQALQVARKFWARKKEALWLVPILANAKSNDLTAEEQKAVAAIPASAPAFHTVQFHLARLAAYDNKLDAMDGIVSAALNSAELPVSSRNRWLRMKLVSAKTFEDFLQAAPREQAEKNSGVPITKEASKEVKPGTDTDFRRHVLQHLSLAQMKQVWQAGKAFQFPDLAAAIWSRAVIFKDYASAEEMNEAVLNSREKAGITTRHLYQRLQDGKDAVAKQQAVGLILANAPELHPHTISRRGVPITWGCGARQDEQASTDLDAMIPNFMSKEARATLQKEQKQLLALPIRSEFLAPMLLDFAKVNPTEPELPKALHFFVASTRFECGGRDEKAGRPHYSKEVFQLLHKRYPKNEWTLKTKYFY